MNRISNYFLLGDLHTAALVSEENASIDWMCVPRFDSPSIFTKLLDDDAGNFSLELTPNYRLETAYVQDTAVVEHRIFFKDNELYKIYDFMVPSEERNLNCHYLVREIQVEKDCKITFKFHPKYPYGQEEIDLNFVNNHKELNFNVDETYLNLKISEGKIVQQDNHAHIEIDAKANETYQILFSFGNEIINIEYKNLLNQTKSYWDDWVAKGNYFDFCSNLLKRSAITLKLMQFAETGGIVAATTTSLPESRGNERNWDYRYVWMRDATFAIYAFLVTGHKNEINMFLMYVRNIIKTHLEKEETLQIMYTVNGDLAPAEQELDYLKGFENSTPVRIGNAASAQLQLDIYGAIIDSYYFSYKNHIDENVFPKEYLVYLADLIIENWDKADHGIWEVRNESQYTYSKVMAWVGLDRLLTMKDHLNLDDKKVIIYENTRARIKDWIWNNCYDEKTGILSQKKDNDDLDATNFLFVLLKFLDKNDPRTKKIITKTAEKLVKDEIFVYRYLNDDNLEGKEGSFLLCSFWYISALAIVGEAEKAKELFTKLEDKFHSSGLISEQYDVKNDIFLGNFPQAFSHMGYIMAARYIDKYLHSS